MTDVTERHASGIERKNTLEREREKYRNESKYTEMKNSVVQVHF